MGGGGDGMGGGFVSVQKLTILKLKFYNFPAIVLYLKSINIL